MFMAGAEPDGVLVAVLVGVTVAVLVGVLVGVLVAVLPPGVGVRVLVGVDELGEIGERL